MVVGCSMGCSVVLSEATVAHTVVPRTAAVPHVSRTAVVPHVPWTAARGWEVVRVASRSSTGNPMSSTVLAVVMALLVLVVWQSPPWD